MRAESLVHSASLPAPAPVASDQQFYSGSSGRSDNDPGSSRSLSSGTGPECVLGACTKDTFVAVAGGLPPHVLVALGPVLPLPRLGYAALFAFFC